MHHKVHAAAEREQAGSREPLCFCTVAAADATFSGCLLTWMIPKFFLRAAFFWRIFSFFSCLPEKFVEGRDG